MQWQPGCTHVYSKIDEDTVSRVCGDSAQYHQMTSLDRIPAVTVVSSDDVTRQDTCSNRNEREFNTLTAVRLQMIRRSSLSDFGEEERMWRSKGSGLLLRLSANPSWKRIVWWIAMTCCRHIGEWGVYQKMGFTLLTPSAATAEGCCWRIPEIMDLTVEQRLVWAQKWCRDGGRAGKELTTGLRV